ncbi:hypothetical protein TIFTF001_034029 [Ficus carica]|uniref:Uncharacterized protein n=1 Tax=Ficus carica TaxID=3494 RepID=A0AA88J4L3_FICCA|nr:hypothetical protein TIFTF001_034029 [Ficus carica]
MPSSSEANSNPTGMALFPPPSTTPSPSLLPSGFQSSSWSPVSIALSSDLLRREQPPFSPPSRADLHIAISVAAISCR